MDDIIRFSVSLPKQLLDELDNKVATQGYASRSEFTRDLIREKIVHDNWEFGNDGLIGVLTIIYDHHQSELLNKMTKLQHNSNLNIVCSTHVHLDHCDCLETIVLKGSAIEIKEFSDKIGGLKGVKFSELTKAAIPNS